VHSHNSSVKAHDTCNDFQHIIRSAPDVLKEKRSLCLLLSFIPELSLVWLGMAA